MRAVFSQIKKDEKLHSIDFYACKFSAAVIYYEIHDK